VSDANPENEYGTINKNHMNALICKNDPLHLCYGKTPRRFTASAEMLGRCGGYFPPWGQFFIVLHHMPVPLHDDFILVYFVIKPYNSLFSLCIAQVGVVETEAVKTEVVPEGCS